MYSPLIKHDQRPLERGEQSRPVELILQRARVAFWAVVGIAVFEVVVMILHWFFAGSAFVWTVTPVLPDDPTDVIPALVDQRQSTDFVLVNLFSFGWLAPAMLLMATTYWRRARGAMPVVNFIVQSVAVIGVLISTVDMLNLIGTCNKPTSEGNVANSDWYCCAYWNTTTAGCANLGHRCGIDIAPSDLHTGTAATVHSIIGILFACLIAGFNLTYMHMGFTPACYDVLEAESTYLGLRPTLQPRPAPVVSPVMQAQEGPTPADQPEQVQGRAPFPPVISLKNE
jgi:hypothetical protein